MYPTGLMALIDVAGVRTEFGSPVRIYPYGDVPPNVVTPYAAHDLIAGTPENNLDAPPTHDDERIQFSVWADTAVTLTAATSALRTRLQEFGYINSCTSLGRDAETRRYGMALDWSRLENW